MSHEKKSSDLLINPFKQISIFVFHTNSTANSSDPINDVTFSPDVFTFPPEVLKNPDEGNASDHLHSNQNDRIVHEELAVQYN